MEIATIKGDEVLLIYHPSDESAEVGQQYKIIENTEAQDGLVVQIISNDSLDYVGLQQELIQEVLEDRMVETIRQLDRETGLGQMRALKVATAKIRKRIVSGQWQTWDGWIPTRNVSISYILAEELLPNVVKPTGFPVTFSSYADTPVQIDGESLNMVNVITGVKGSGKSHTAKHFVLGLSELGVPVIVFDVNGEYVGLPSAQVLRWGDDFLPALDEMGYPMLLQVVRDLRPLTENSAAVFDGQLPGVWRARQAFCANRKENFTIDINHLLQIPWGGGQYVADAIVSRLRTIEERGLFFDYGQPNQQPARLRTIFENAANGAPIVFDMRDLGGGLQRALVGAINAAVKDICRDETINGTNRYPFVFYEEAHFYINDETIIDIITRGRHIGMGAFFVTNTPQELPRTVFRQIDNLFLLSLTHNDDIKNVSNSAFTDEETIRSFATRMPPRHALIIGNVTNRYPLVVKVDPLPDNVPASGQTRSTWDRYKRDNS